MTEPRTLLLDMLNAGLAAADPARVMAPFVHEVARHTGPGRIVVMGAGKAAASMARAVEFAWPEKDSHRLEGLVVTRYGHAVPTKRIEVVEAAHPVPDAAGRRAAWRMLTLARGLGPDDFALILLSGGGSALLALPLPGVTLEDKGQITKALLASGASIREINVVRTALSAIKGGRLAAACHPARHATLAISDVPGDDPAVIASGPTVPAVADAAEARAILRGHQIDLPGHVASVLEAAEHAPPSRTHPCFRDATYEIVARPADMLAAAAETARRAGFTPISLGDRLEGEAREVGTAHGTLALAHAAMNDRLAILSGGELTVTLQAMYGAGGPNREYALALALALGGAPGIWALAADTDGADGTGEIAGAIVAPDTLKRAAEAGLDARQFLNTHDSGAFFEALRDSVITGPTLTNVNDLRVLLIGT